MNQLLSPKDQRPQSNPKTRHRDPTPFLFGKPFALLGVMGLLFGLIWLYRYASRFDPLSNINDPLTSLNDPSIELTEAVMISRSAGKQLWKVSADDVKVYPVPSGSLENYSRVEFTGLSGGEFYRGGRLEASFCATHADYRPETHRFDIIGPMHLISTQGDIVESDSCIWTEQADQGADIRFDKGARATIQNHLVTSPFVMYAPKKRMVNCPQGAEISLDDTVVQAGALRWDVAKGLIVCSNRFTATGKTSFVSAAGAELLLTQSNGLSRSNLDRSQIAHVRANNGHLHMRIEDSDSWRNVAK